MKYLKIKIIATLISLVILIWLTFYAFNYLINKNVIILISFIIIHLLICIGIGIWFSNFIIIRFSKLKESQELLQQQNEKLLVQLKEDEENNEKMKRSKEEMKLDELSLLKAYSKIQENKKKMVQKNKILESQKKELEEKNEEIMAHRKAIEEKNELLNNKNAEMKLNEVSLLKAYRKIQENKKIMSAKNKELEIQKRELQDQKALIQAQADILKQANLKITNQKEEIEKVHKHMMDSITYAQRIQSAVLPGTEMVNLLLPYHFILYMPRNIVSGDFYFIKQIRNFTLVAAADCTGHGVPGAFLSMLVLTLLNEIVRKTEIINSSAVLNELRFQIKNSLQQSGQKGEQQDGLDISFCAINIETLEVSFAGAHNPLWLIRNESVKNMKDMKDTKDLKEVINDNATTIQDLDLQHSTFYVYEADRQPVGVFYKEKPFTEQKIQLQSGDTFYIFSDGYESQFGGEKKEKFQTKQLRDLLSEIQNLSMPEQKKVLETKFIEWKGNNEQTDDVLVVGVKI
jgi:serine phosphatase RsbU (regulator of sigma subunit)